LSDSTFFKELVEFGIKAPSGHNSQPWHFTLAQHQIQIHPDMSRSLPVVDADDHELYISLGCAVENICIAARHFEMSPKVKILEDNHKVSGISILLERENNVPKDRLFDYINERHTTRMNYSARSIPGEDRNQLIKSASSEGIKLISFVSPDEVEQIKPFVLKASEMQFKNRSFRKELVQWLRFSEREARKKSDGIWVASMGLPNMNRFIGTLIMKYFVSALSEVKRWKGNLQNSDSFIMFLAEKNDITHWIKTGRAFQRFGLTATGLDIKHAHVNMPCEEPEVREKMVKKLKLDGLHPLLLIRIGYAASRPDSFRRNVDDVILNG
jgi:hypothetical protein